MQDKSNYHKSSRAVYLPTYGQTEFFFIYMGIPFFAFMAIYFAPVNVLDQWSWARVLCEKMWHMLPAIKREAIHSPFPQVRQFGACLAAALMPAQILLHLLAFFSIGKNFYLNMDAHKKMSWAKGWLVSLALLLLACACLAHEPQSPLGKAGRLMETNRFSSAFTDSGLLTVIPACLTLLFFSTIGIFLKFINRESKS